MAKSETTLLIETLKANNEELLKQVARLTEQVECKRPIARYLQ